MCQWSDERQSQVRPNKVLVFPGADGQSVEGQWGVSWHWSWHECWLDFGASWPVGENGGGQSGGQADEYLQFAAQGQADEGAGGKHFNGA